MKDVSISTVSISVVFLSYLIQFSLGITFVPERSDVAFANEKYVYNVSTYISRYGRRSAYYFNLLVGLNHVWGNNVTIHLQFFELQNNQYKRSFVEFQFKLCDMHERDQYFAKLIQMVLDKHGISCPMQPGIYNFANITLPSEKLPNTLPFQRGKVEITWNHLGNHDILFTLSIKFTVKK